MRISFRKMIFALAAVCLLAPLGGAWAQDSMGSLYVTPKILYSYQMMDADGANWNDNGWNRGVLGGDSNDNAFGGGVSVGYDISGSYNVPLRVELEYLARTSSDGQYGPSIVGGYIANQHFTIQAQTLMANAFFDIHNESAFTPYLGGGLGMAYLSTDYDGAINAPNIGSYSGSNSNWNFAWNVGGGVAYQLTDVLALDLGYRYFDFGTAEGPAMVFQSPGLAFTPGQDVDFSAHEVSLGLRINIW